MKIDELLVEGGGRDVEIARCVDSLGVCGFDNVWPGCGRVFQPLSYPEGIPG
jgi:hypothetical protein